MTEEQIKEQISRNFVRLIAARGGYKCKDGSPDHGVDLTVAEVRGAMRRGRMRYLETGRFLDLQIKSTCESRIHPTATGFKYDLESKTYNDLVERWTSRPAAPLLLVLMVLPDDEGQWLTVSPEKLLVRRTAYWWRPENGIQMTTNTTSVRIEIPHTNIVDLNFVPTSYSAFYS